jgi:hypothetical protein
MNTYCKCGNMVNVQKALYEDTPFKFVGYEKGKMIFQCTRCGVKLWG